MQHGVHPLRVVVFHFRDSSNTSRKTLAGFHGFRASSVRYRTEGVVLRHFARAIKQHPAISYRCNLRVPLALTPVFDSFAKRRLDPRRRARRQLPPGQKALCARAGPFLLGDLPIDFCSGLDGVIGCDVFGSGCRRCPQYQLRWRGRYCCLNFGCAEFPQVSKLMRSMPELAHASSVTFRWRTSGTL